MTAGPAGVANGFSFGPVLSADGKAVAFASAATDLIAGDTNGQDDVFAVANAPPTIGVDRASLRFAAVTTPTSFASQTGTQQVRLTKAGVGIASWTTTSSDPWLVVSPTAGTGSAALHVSVRHAGALPLSGVRSGLVRVTLTGSNQPLSIAVTLRLFASGSSGPPEGQVDTPIDFQTSVTGAVPFTGWAVDDVEVSQVTICRAAFGQEVAPIDPNCGGRAQLFVGSAVFIDGARPDVAGLFASYPANTKAGWGFMVLTNMLPNQGNGTYRFFAWAKDREGNAVQIGTRTMTCANAAATKPFGAIDTPTQGGGASGTAFVNFGWALTPLPKMIPVDGSTIAVLIDGAAVGTVTYNNPRADIQALFPGLNNTNGAIGFRALDTTVLPNGLHTISWTVVDNHGAVEGIGSRFFTVANSGSPVTAGAAVTAPSARLTAAAPATSSSLLGRRGWDLAAPLELFEPDAAGLIVVRSEEVSRVELHLGDGPQAGHLRTSEGLSTIPVGSRFDPATGVFTWAPGVGFVGAYDLVFVSDGGSASARTRDVRIVLQPKGSHLSGPQLVIDTPRWQQDVGQPFVLAGWAADLDAPLGTGVATVRAYPLTGGLPVFLGATAYGGARPDVAAVHGAPFEAVGFGLPVQGLLPGHYDLAVFAWSTELADFAPAKIVRITVR